MRKICLLVFLCFLTAPVFAQWEIGVKINPSIATSRVVAPKEFNFNALNAKLRFGGGVIADYFFGANYAFTTGLIYNVRGAGVSYDYTTTSGAITTRQQGSDEFSIHSLEIPFAIKLYTNEVAPDIRLYFQAGGSFNPRISTKVNNEKLDQNNDKFNKRFNIADISALFGLGAEMQLGESTKVFGGLSYHRGLVDVDKFYEKKDQFNNKNIEIKNSYVALDLGLKF